MARFLSTANLFRAALPTAPNTRGFAAVATRAVAAAEEKAAACSRKRAIEGLADHSSAWVPDPVTGYYRPASSANGVDPAELRELLLSSSRPPRV